MVRPRFYRQPWEVDHLNPLEVALVRVVISYYGLLLLRDYCEPVARVCDKLSAFYRNVILWLARGVTSPLNVLALYAVISMCGVPTALSRGVSRLSLTACAVARRPMQVVDLCWR